LRRTARKPSLTQNTRTDIPLRPGRDDREQAKEDVLATWLFHKFRAKRWGDRAARTPLVGRGANRSEGAMEPTSLLAYLTTCYTIDQVLSTSKEVLVQGHTTASSANCPRCGRSSRRVHSYYHRQVQELPWLGRQVRLLLRVRRFHCDAPTCPQQTFAESLEGLAPRYARRSRRSTSLGWP
jgi:hypothetical protein